MQRIFLIGYMGVGKTTLGKALADRTGLSFIDLDLFIEGRYRKTIRQIFEAEGEEAFREIERRALHEVAEFEDIVLSTGGGTPCFFDNMTYMNRVGTTVYLKASPEALTERIALAPPCATSMTKPSTPSPARPSRTAAPTTNAPIMPSMWSDSSTTTTPTMRLIDYNNSYTATGSAAKPSPHTLI